ncbi:helix-turn-helix domain-containing protein [Thalassospira sp. A3_1]|uniref:AraC family transcriptional regulator n=1 Tax=Thalassospira sp. A3_1 TaxID=2821088 RepID=UPI001AD9A56B|nr:helix-turn-helix domain-containing protein [Thalassospira sp. A3_1]MBO9507886.1 AraC family transcriptional regulator [Thalassospira sp. A3_1]
MMAEFARYVDITIAAVGLVQGLFLCFLLRAEGVRAFAANRWMMLFLGAVMLNLFNDVTKRMLPAEAEEMIVLFFFPANFVIVPAIYLYFREISGTPSTRPWIHFVLVGVIFNVIAWLLSFEADGPNAPSRDVMLSFVIRRVCWFTFFAQSAFYIVLLWNVSQRYFHQTQEQLGADRNAMRRWIIVILGGVSLIFVTVLLSWIASRYLPQDLAMSGAGLAFVLVLFAMTYVIATQPVLFVMADWPGEGEVIDIPDSVDAKGPPAAGPINSGYGEVSQPDIPSFPRPLLDEDGAAIICRRLDNIRKRGDLLFDPLISMPKLARAVGVSPNQLSYVLNHHIGQKFFNYVNSARVEEARAVLIAEPDRTILDVALSVGFNSKSTFNLAFKTLTGETPSAVRDSARHVSDMTDPPPEQQSDDQTRVPISLGPTY